MQTLDQCLQQLVRDRSITMGDARSRAVDKSKFM
jgi:Tfp pilus assembly pilus retraction ATPase PilT